MIGKTNNNVSFKALYVDEDAKSSIRTIKDADGLRPLEKGFDTINMLSERKECDVFISGVYDRMAGKTVLKATINEQNQDGSYISQIETDFKFGNLPMSTHAEDFCSKVCEYLKQLPDLDKEVNELLAKYEKRPQ